MGDSLNYLGVELWNSVCVFVCTVSTSVCILYNQIYKIISQKFVDSLQLALKNMQHRLLPPLTFVGCSP